MKSAIIAGALGLGVLALVPTQSEAAVYARGAAQGLLAADAPARLTAPVQYWRGGPGWRPGPRYYGRPGPYWGQRAWVRRPYYGTVVAGVVLGTIVTVAAVGMVPRRPAPDLCWYWADPYRNRGYWDYCY
jgi:hypothetical protein